MTPTLASAWLEKNTHNRPRQTRLVNRYAQLMTEGRWLVTSDAIAFDTSGRLVNGQHRLGAIVKSGTAQTMLVARGLAPDVFQVIDYGKKRSAADTLAVEGYKNASVMAAMCKLVFNWESGNLRRALHGSIENGDVIRIASGYPEIEAMVTHAFRHAKDFSGMVPASYMCFIYWAFARHGSVQTARIGQFTEQVATGIGFTSKRDPSYLLRQLLLDDAMSRKQNLVRLSGQARIAAIIHAANAFMQSEELVKLRIKTDPFPEPICGLELNL
ncbi:MAG TPA: hypothetical protein VKP65_24785 [Rhodothermales bacterium]|nr:hypothetical protein [Rhodothermales bacterium]